MNDYISSSEFARQAGISNVKASEALRRCISGGTWRGKHLDVRINYGAGGRGGKRYQVRWPTQEILNDASAEHAERRPAQQAQFASISGAPEELWQFRRAVIDPALGCPKRSQARAEAVRALAKMSFLTPSGSRQPFCERTIRAWIDEYERRGLAGLASKTRADRGRKRTLISRAWDKHLEDAGIDRDRRNAIAEKLTLYVKSLWAGPATFSGWTRTAEMASLELYRLTSQAVSGDLDALRQACVVTRQFVERWREFSAVGTFHRDRKRYEDTSRPRVRLTNEGMQPMELVMGDVHPMDLLYRREDGSTATVKLIAFQDVATHRIKLTPIFLGKGEGVRTEHVVSSFVNMVLDPLWGLPKQLYLDNGPEYQWNSFIDEAMALSGTMIKIDGKHADGARGTVRAQAYNASAKGLLEGSFGQLERHFFSMVPGWIGGDRLNKKSANVGKALECYPGSRQELINDIANAELGFNGRRQHSQLAGRSPTEAFNSLVERGWTRTDMAEDDLRAVFCKKIARQVHQGAIRHRGDLFRNDAVAALPAKARVLIGEPLWGARDRLAVWDADGNSLGVAFLAPVYDYGDLDGARESSRLQKINRDRIRQMASETVRLDGRTLLAEAASAAPTSVLPDRGAVVRFDGNHSAAGKALGQSQEASLDRERAEEDARRAKHHSVIRRLLA